MTAQYEPSRVSIIVPVGARRSNLKTLYAEYKAGVAAIGLPREFIFVLDGPRTDAARALEELQHEGEAITVVHLTRCFGEAAALMAGFERATGNAILTLPAYHQIEAIDLRKLITALDSSDIAIGYRFPRAGNAIEKMRRGAFHGMVNFVTGARFRDLGCGARALRRQVFEELDLYGDQHRFIAILASRLGFRVAEVAVRQSAQDRHSRVYRPREYAHQVLDLVSIFFLVRFTKRPLRFFGMVGALTFTIGALLITYLGIERLAFHEKLADRPALLLAALLIVLGMQIFALGLLGELIIFTHARSMKDYRVEEVIQYPESEEASASESLGEARESGADSHKSGMRQTAPPLIA
jgi:glycosyltransferase involved in cell wall biosynthesis